MLQPGAPERTAISSAAALYLGRVMHTRMRPVHHRFAYRVMNLLIDLDRLDEADRQSRLFGVNRASVFSFHECDHGKRDGASLSSHVRGLAEQRDIDLSGGRILLLCYPRLFGYVFNPLSVFYCLQATGAITHVVAEVRNTYGGRHCYLLVPDSNGDAETNKEFYVSPFYPVDGLYRMRLPRPGDDLLVSVSLQRCTDRPFSAVMTGTRRGDIATLWTALRHPLTTRAVMFGIKRHGITLYRKGLRPFSRSRREEARV